MDSIPGAQDSVTKTVAGRLTVVLVRWAVPAAVVFLLVESLGGVAHTGFASWGLLAGFVAGVVWDSFMTGSAYAVAEGAECVAVGERRPRVWPALLAGPLAAVLGNLVAIIVVVLILGQQAAQVSTVVALF